jgi:hypothetical protein
MMTAPTEGAPMTEPDPHPARPSNVAVSGHPLVGPAGVEMAIDRRELHVDTGGPSFLRLDTADRSALRRG